MFPLWLVFLSNADQTGLDGVCADRLLGLMWLRVCQQRLSHVVQRGLLRATLPAPVTRKPTAPTSWRVPCCTWHFLQASGTTLDMQGQAPPPSEGLWSAERRTPWNSGREMLNHCMSRQDTRRMLAQRCGSEHTCAGMILQPLKTIDKTSHSVKAIKEGITIKSQ